MAPHINKNIDKSLLDNIVSYNNYFLEAFCSHYRTAYHLLSCTYNVGSLLKIMTYYEPKRNFGGVTISCKNVSATIFEEPQPQGPPIFINISWLTKDMEDKTLANQHVIFISSYGYLMSVDAYQKRHEMDHRSMFAKTRHVYFVCHKDEDFKCFGKGDSPEARVKIKKVFQNNPNLVSYVLCTNTRNSSHAYRQIRSNHNYAFFPTPNKEYTQLLTSPDKTAPINLIKDDTGTFAGDLAYEYVATFHPIEYRYLLAFFTNTHSDFRVVDIFTGVAFVKEGNTNFLNRVAGNNTIVMVLFIAYSNIS